MNEVKESEIHNHIDAVKTNTNASYRAANGVIENTQAKNQIETSVRSSWPRSRSHRQPFLKIEAEKNSHLYRLKSTDKNVSGQRIAMGSNRPKIVNHPEEEELTHLYQTGRRMKKIVQSEKFR